MTPLQLNVLAQMIGNLHDDVPEWEQIVVTQRLGDGTPIGRLIAGTMNPARVLLEALCAIRDSAPLVICGDAQCLIQPVYRRVRDAAELVRCSAQIVRQQVGCVTVRFESRLVSA